MNTGVVCDLFVVLHLEEDIPGLFQAPGHLQIDCLVKGEWTLHLCHIWTVFFDEVNQFMSFIYIYFFFYRI